MRNRIANLIRPRFLLSLVILVPSMAMFALNRDIPEALAVAIGAVVLYWFKRDDTSADD